MPILETAPTTPGQLREHMKRRLTSYVFFVLAVVVQATGTTTIRTDDGFALSLGDDGRAAAIQLDDRELPPAAEPALFWIRDAATRSAFTPVALAITSSAGVMELKSKGDALGLRLTATVSNHGGYLQIDGEVAAVEPIDRCVDLKISLPVAGNARPTDRGLYNGPATDVRKGRKQKAGANDEIDVAGAGGDALYPLSPITVRGGKAGLTLAVPPSHPTRFLTGADAQGGHIIIRIGISPAAARPNRTPFRVIAYRHDSAWGFRAALARYYEFYRDEFFARRAKRIGAWTTQNASKLVHPELYAYHEAGFGTWRHPAGTDSGVNVKLTLEHLDEGPVARTLGDYERLGELALDEKLGLYSLPYTIVGQRQFLQLPELPKNYDEAMRVLATWTPREPIRFDGPPQAGSFRSVQELRAIIRNSTLHDAQHRLAYVARPYRGPTLTFPQNPNPSLFRDEDKPTIAKYTLDYYLPMMLESPYVDGLYMDSLGRWCGYYNFRTEHFRYASVPLTYQGTPPQVCLWSLQSHAEYMWEARRRLHAQGKIFMANGVHPERVMLGFSCDVMGGEGAPAYTTGESFYALRVAAGIKPYCLLNATHRVTPRLWNSCLYLGYLMGCNDPKGLADEARYLPLLIKCNEAGWQPVTHARAAPTAVGVERWGGQNVGSPLMFTVMNRSPKSVSAELIIDLRALRQPGTVQVTTAPDAIRIATERRDQQLVLRFKLDAEQASVIQLRE